jgi:hypothetical protein
VYVLVLAVVGELGPPAPGAAPAEDAAVGDAGVGPVAAVVEGEAVGPNTGRPRRTGRTLCPTSMDFISSWQVAMDGNCTSRSSSSRARREEGREESRREVEEGQHLALATGSMFSGGKEASLPFGITRRLFSVWPDSVRACMWWLL